jgi:hypothetical protein
MSVVSDRKMLRMPAGRLAKLRVGLVTTQWRIANPPQVEQPVEQPAPPGKALS